MHLEVEEISFSATIIPLLIKSQTSTPISGEYYKISRQDLGKTTLKHRKCPHEMTPKDDPKNYQKKDPLKWPFKKIPPEVKTEFVFKIGAILQSNFKYEYLSS